MWPKKNERKEKEKTTTPQGNMIAWEVQNVRRWTRQENKNVPMIYENATGPLKGRGEKGK